MEYEYKSEMVYYDSDELKAANKKVQDLLDKYSKDGWRLHTFKVENDCQFFVCIFEREM